MTEYGKEFVKAFTEENVSAVSFTDLDVVGVVIALERAEAFQE